MWLKLADVLVDVLAAVARRQDADLQAVLNKRDRPVTETSPTTDGTQGAPVVTGRHERGRGRRQDREPPPPADAQPNDLGARGARVCHNEIAAASSASANTASPGSESRLMLVGRLGLSVVPFKFVGVPLAAYGHLSIKSDFGTAFRTSHAHERHPHDVALTLYRIGPLQIGEAGQREFPLRHRLGVFLEAPIDLAYPLSDRKPAAAFVEIRIREIGQRMPRQNLVNNPFGAHDFTSINPVPENFLDLGVERGWVEQYYLRRCWATSASQRCASTSDAVASTNSRSFRPRVAASTSMSSEVRAM